MTTTTRAADDDINHSLVRHPRPNVWLLQVQDAFNRTRALTVRRDRSQLVIIVGDALGVVLPLHLLPVLRQILVNAHDYDPERP
jgi:hypothetical protein